MYSYRRSEVQSLNRRIVVSLAFITLSLELQGSLLCGSNCVFRSLWVMRVAHIYTIFSRVCFIYVLFLSFTARTQCFAVLKVLNCVFLRVNKCNISPVLNYLNAQRHLEVQCTLWFWPWVCCGWIVRITKYLFCCRAKSTKEDMLTDKWLTCLLLVCLH